jgi:hypothetical protein
MLPGRLTQIIWPLRAKLFQPIFLQQRPKFTGGRMVPSSPTLPWQFKNRSLFGRINFGRYTLPLVFRDYSGMRQAFVPETAKPKFKRPSVVEPRPPATRWTFSGFTYDATAVALASCSVELYRSDNDLVTGSFVSNSDGSWLINSNNGGRHYLVAYKTGSPDLAGTTLNTLQSSVGIPIYLRDPTKTTIYPVASNVESGVSYGDGGTQYTGTVTLPDPIKVEAGITYGAGGTEFTGTLTGGGGYFRRGR